MSTPIQNGTMTAQGRTWPLYERTAFHVEVLGTIDPSLATVGEIATELRAVLDRYGVTVRIEPISVVEMSPEDQAEKNALDEAAIQH